VVLRKMLIVGVSCVVTLVGSLPVASAATIIDTIQSDIYCVPTCNSQGYSLSGNGGQSIALPFSSPTAVVIDGIKAYIAMASGFTGSFNIGIMADASGVPSGTFLDEVSVPTGPVSAPIILASLSWPISGGTPYWLAAIATQGTYRAEWQFNNSLSGVYAYTRGSWLLQDGPLPEAIITGGRSSSLRPGR